MKQILVPYNHCLEDEYALDFAAKLAKQSHSHLYILTFGNDLQEVEAENLEYENIKKQNRIGLRTKTGITGDLISNIAFLDEKSIQIEKLSEFDYSEINRLIKKLEIDLVVAGLHKKTKINEHIFGSITEKLVRTVNCPIITVKEKFQYERVKTIVFASSFEEEIKLPFFEFLKISGQLKAKTHLLYVNTPDNFKNSDYINQTMNWFSEDYQKNSFTLNTYDAHSVEEGVLAFAKEINADLIGIISHEKTRFTLMSSSLSEKLINISEIPILNISIV